MLETDRSAVRIGAHGVVKMAVVCALCKAGNVPKEHYRLREGIQKGGGPTECITNWEQLLMIYLQDCVPR